MSDECDIRSYVCHCRPFHTRYLFFVCVQWLASDKMKLEQTTSYNRKTQLERRVQNLEGGIKNIKEKSEKIERALYKEREALQVLLLPSSGTYKLRVI